MARKKFDPLPVTPEEEGLGKWGRMYLLSLKQNDPQQYHELKLKATLDATARRVAIEARDVYQTTLGALMESEGPAPAHPIEWEQWMRTLTSSAREVVYPIVLVKRPQDREEEEVGPSMSLPAR